MRIETKYWLLVAVIAGVFSAFFWYLNSDRQSPLNITESNSDGGESGLSTARRSTEATDRTERHTLIQQATTIDSRSNDPINSDLADETKTVIEERLSKVGAIAITLHPDDIVLPENNQYFTAMSPSPHIRIDFTRHVPPEAAGLTGLSLTYDTILMTGAGIPCGVMSTREVSRVSSVSPLSPSFQDRCTLLTVSVGLELIGLEEAVGESLSLRVRSDGYEATEIRFDVRKSRRMQIAACVSTSVIAITIISDVELFVGVDEIEVIAECLDGNARRLPVVLKIGPPSGYIRSPVTEVDRCVLLFRGHYLFESEATNLGPYVGATLRVRVKDPNGRVAKGECKIG